VVARGVRPDVWAPARSLGTPQLIRPSGQLGGHRQGRPFPCRWLVRDRARAPDPGHDRTAAGPWWPPGRERRRFGHVRIVPASGFTSATRLFPAC